jgi:hypothetical protein
VAAERFARIEAGIATILRVLAEHSRMLAEHRRMLEGLSEDKEDDLIINTSTPHSMTSRSTWSEGADRQARS